MPGKGLMPEGTAKTLKRRSTLSLFRRSDVETDNDGGPDAGPATHSSATSAPSQRAASEDAPRKLSRGAKYSRESERSSSPSFSLSNPKPQRFSLMRFRHASDPQLAARARHQANRDDRDIPPVPAMPTSMRPTQRARRSESHESHLAAPMLMVTAPTDAMPKIERRKSRFHPFTRQKQEAGPTTLETHSTRPSLETRRTRTENRKSRFGNFGKSRDPAEELRKFAGSGKATPSSEPDSQPLATYQNGSSSYTLPAGRRSESSRSDHQGKLSADLSRSSLQRPKPQVSHSFQWLPKRNRQRNTLFPLPVHIAPTADSSRLPAEPRTPRASTSARSTATTDESPERLSPGRQTSTVHEGIELLEETVRHNNPHAAADGGVLRADSSASLRSAHSSPALRLRNTHSRTRSSTMTSVRSDISHPPTPPQITASGRTSTSTTAGRSSFSNLFHLSHRFRHGSDPHSPRQGSPGHGSATPGLDSQTNSLSLSRELAVLPEREEGETAMQYLGRVEDVAHKRAIPCILSKRTEEFYLAVMRSFMRKSNFFGDPLDMALRKLLMEIDLPKETQQIDRVLSSFAHRYHECNPGVFPDPDKAYYMTFSLLLLQSDAFNRSNKRKMTKHDYIKNSSTEGVSNDILDCFYDNIIYTPFIRVEDDVEVKTMSSRKSRKTQRVVKNAVQAVEQGKPKTTKEPLDPYTLILGNRLDVLRPPIKNVIAVDDPYTYLGTAPAFEKRLLRSMKCGIIQLESSRSRPDAFKSQSGIDNPNDANIGIIDLPVEKVGVLWRKDPKKRTGRSPWQEWGAILTGGGLYFFKNPHFVKNFIDQYEHHKKHGDEGQLTFKPAIQQWKADFLMPTENGVALYDSTYKKHKHAFLFFRHNNADEVFLADSEAEMNDWMMRLNCQAAFKTYGIRARGLLGGHYDGQRQRGMRRLESSHSASTLKTVQTPTGEVTIQSGKIDRELAEQISVARRDNMQIKITEMEDKLAELIAAERGQRRDASHLFVLAPIQERTRQQLMHSASRVAAQLKWSRIEIWRIKCHRDILALDLEDERIEIQRRQDMINRLSPKPSNATSVASQSTGSTVKPKPNGTQRLNSTATDGTAESPAKSVASRNSILRADTRTSHRSVSQQSSRVGLEEEDVFKTPPETTPAETTPAASPAPPPTPPDTTPVSVKSPSLVAQRGSTASKMNKGHSPDLRPHSPSTLESPTPSDLKTNELSNGTEGTRPDFPALEASPTGLDGMDGDRPDTASSSELGDPDRSPSDASFGAIGSPESKKSSRRSLQKTLREHAHRDHSKDHHHIRSASKKYRHASVSSVAVPEEAVADDANGTPGHGLKRHEGSFTVHGKKASVISFPHDWTNMDASERLKTLARHESQKDTERLSNHAAHSPASATSEGKGKARAIDSGFMVPPSRSSVSLKDRRAASHSVPSSAKPLEESEEIGTATSLRKFSTSSGPPRLDDLVRSRRSLEVRNGKAEDQLGSLAKEEEEEEEEREENDEAEWAKSPKPIPTDSAVRVQA